MVNTDLDVYWRKEVVPSFVGYALREIRGDLVCIGTQVDILDLLLALTEKVRQIKGA